MRRRRGACPFYNNLNAIIYPSFNLGDNPHGCSNRFFNIIDEGDGFELSMFESGVQVGGGFFPVDALGVDHAHALAVSLGRSFAGNNEAPLQGLRRGV